MKIIDLSHPIVSQPPCTFSLADKVPVVTFEEGDSRGTFFVTSRLDNLYSNTGTQIDFPGHLSNGCRTSTIGYPVHATVGEYPLERFIGKAAVLDFAPKMDFLSKWFDDRGVYQRGRISDFAEFLREVRSLEVSPADFHAALAAAGDDTLGSLTGVIFYCGNTGYWTHEVFESWEYRYFYGPFLSQETIALLLEAHISFVGIDAFQIEDPISNLRGDELPLMVNEEARDIARRHSSDWRHHTNHELLLASGMLIYESLCIPSAAVGRIGDFSGAPLNLQLPGLDDDALARPYLVLDS